MRRHLFWLLVACGCGGSAADHPAEIFDPCGVNSVFVRAGTDAQRARVDEAIALWDAVGTTGLQQEPTSAISIVFGGSLGALYGYYDDASATVYVNANLGSVQAFDVTIAHELGHALGLVHIPVSERPSVMNPGNLTTAPTDADVAALTSMWGTCPR